MLQEQKRLFNQWRLSLKDYWDFFLICYKIQRRTIKQKIYKQESIRDQISWFLIDIYFEYEYQWIPLSIKDISRLLLIEESWTSKLLDRILTKLKNKFQKFNRS